MPSPNVLRGRPSRNCGNCRAVKRRCDQKVPHCGQCIRLREKCPGYRNEWELVFRDQTSHTIKRSREKRAKSITLSEARELLPPRQPGVNLDDIGVNYFLRHFVTGDQPHFRGYLNYVPDKYHLNVENPTLTTSMAAVGLMALSNSTQQSDLSLHAHAKYSEAVRNVNAALQSPVECVKDSTLMSVISLGVFEHAIGFESWVRHVQGAAALVVARGKNQFSSPIAIRMFSQVRADLILACLHGTKPFPEGMLELQIEAAKQIDDSNPLWLMGELGARCATLLFDIRTKPEEASWYQFLDKASMIEHELQCALGLLYIQEPYKTVHSSSGDPNIVYKGRFDVYKDSWAIRVWNNTRSLQMVVCEILGFLLNKVLATDLDHTVAANLRLKIEEILRTLDNIGKDILASIPQALEFVSPSLEARAADNLSIHSSVSGGYMLTWCLYMVGKCVVTDRETRKWIIKCLQNIGTNLGVSIALHLVNDVIRIAEWSS